MQYGKGKYNDSDRFWTELAFKTRSWLLEVNDPEQVRAVITIAIYKGKGTNCLKVSLRPLYALPVMKFSRFSIQIKISKKQFIYGHVFCTGKMICERK